MTPSSWVEYTNLSAKPATHESFLEEGLSKFRGHACVCVLNCSALHLRRQIINHDTKRPSQYPQLKLGFRPLAVHVSVFVLAGVGSASLNK